MKERQSRLKAIKNLIKNNTIESQDDLLSLLTKEGYEVTQATLSRDLKLLKVGKVPDGQNGYKYALPGEDENGENEAIYVQDFLRGYENREIKKDYISFINSKIRNSIVKNLRDFEDALNSTPQPSQSKKEEMAKACANAEKFLEKCDFADKKSLLKRTKRLLGQLSKE